MATDPDSTKNIFSSYWLKICSDLHKSTNQAFDKTSPLFKLTNQNDLKKVQSDFNFEQSASNEENDVKNDDSHELGRMYHSLIHSHLMPVLLKRECLLSEHLRRFQIVNSFEEDLTLSRSQLSTSISDYTPVNVPKKFYKFVKYLYGQLEEETMKSNKNNNNSNNNYIYDLNEENLEEDFLLANCQILNMTEAADAAALNQKNNKKKIKKSYSVSGQSSFYSSSDIITNTTNSNDNNTIGNRLEESYTIQLGAQLKSTHNLRIIRCDMNLEFCGPKFSEADYRSCVNQNREAASTTPIFFEPQAIQTSMSLYSNKLCAVILLVSDDHLINNRNNDDGVNNLNKTKRNVSPDSGECQFQSTNLQSQFAEKILVDHVKNNQNNSTTAPKSRLMNLGDFYITKHSNISEAHIVFHLCAFKSNNNSSLTSNSDSNSLTGLTTSPTPSPTKELNNNDESNSNSNENNEKYQTLKQSDLSSRHPVLLGIRNIIKACISYDISTLTLPLLLTHQMTEVENEFMNLTRFFNLIFILF
jgi:hypothetical protein